VIAQTPQSKPFLRALGPVWPTIVLMAASFAALASLAAGEGPRQALAAPDFEAGANLDPNVFLPRPRFIFYVARDGNDNWSGTVATPTKGYGPFATVARARDAIRALKASGRLAGPVAVEIRAGTYYLQTPLVLTPQDSGTRAAPITYQSYPGETAVLSGGEPIRGWRRLRDGERTDVSPAAQGRIWVADIARGGVFNELFINGAPLSRSAAPATTDWRNWPRATPARSVVDGFFFSPGSILPYPDAASAEVNVVPLVGSHPVNFLEPVARLDSASGMIAFSPAAKNYIPMKVLNGSYFRIENVLGAITGPGQWSLDAVRGKVYLWPPAGANPNAAEVTAPRLRMAIELRGNEDQNELVMFINFSRLTIAYFDRARRDQPFPPSPKLRLVWAETQDSAILMRGVEDCSVQRCRIRDVGGMGVRAIHHTRRIRVVDNEITNCGGSAIAFEGYEPGTHDVNRDNLIAGNTVYHCAQSSWRGSAITLLQAGNVTIEDNRISDMPYCGILVSGYPLSYFRMYRFGARGEVYPAPGDAEPAKPQTAMRWAEIGNDPLTIRSVQKFIRGFVDIRHNLVSDTMKILDDGGAIYTGWTHHVVVRNNRIFRTHRSMSYGIYFDAEQVDSVVRDNLVYDCPTVAAPGLGTALDLNNGGADRVENNIFALSNRLFQFWASDGGQVVERNIFLFRGEPAMAVLTAAHKGRMSLRELGLVKGPGKPLAELLAMPIFDPAFQGKGPNLGHSVMDFNVFWSTAGRAAIEPFVAHWRTGGWDVNSVVADPLFVNPEGGDFRLRPLSPALRLGFRPIDVPAAN